MNSGREDWIRTSMDNIPIPDGVISAITTDDSALFATRSEGGIAIAGNGMEEDRSTLSNETGYWILFFAGVVFGQVVIIFVWKSL